MTAHGSRSCSDSIVKCPRSGGDKRLLEVDGFTCHTCEVCFREEQREKMPRWGRERAGDSRLGTLDGALGGEKKKE